MLKSSIIVVRTNILKGGRNGMTDKPRYCQSCGDEVPKSEVYEPVDPINKRPVYDKSKENEPQVIFVCGHCYQDILGIR